MMALTNGETMKAVRFHGQHDLRFEDLPIPRTGKGQVKIKPAWVGICGSGKRLSVSLYLEGSLDEFSRST